MNTTYFLNLVAGNIFGTKVSPAIPEHYYIGLSSTAPTVDGTNVTEPTGGGYARVELNSLGEPAGGNVTNEADIDFAESTGSWGTMTHFVIYDSLNSGNLLMYGPLSQNRQVEAATIMTIRAGSLDLSVVNTTT